MGFKTQAEVDHLRLPKGRADVFVWDAECTGLSVRLQGKKRTFVVWYQANGARRRMTLGDCAGLKLKDARRKATEIVHGARDGQDALAAREATKAKSADTLGRLIEIYLQRRAKPRQRPRSYVETERNLLRRWAPLHGRPVDSITRRDVAAELERIRVEHGPTASVHARVYLSGCYSWAMRQGFAEHNPVVGTEPPAKIVKRERVLTPAELAAIWEATGGDDFSLIVRIMLWTGCRRSEAGGMRWSELTDGVWRIPGSRTKNGRELELPLPRQAAEALAALPRTRGRDLVFGRGAAGFAGWSYAKDALDERLRFSEPWHLHDLRRSLATYMAEMSIGVETIEAILNHARVGVRQIYDRSKLREPKRRALQAYADWLDSVVSGEEQSNVLAFG